MCSLAACSKLFGFQRRRLPPRADKRKASPHPKLDEGRTQRFPAALACSFVFLPFQIWNKTKIPVEIRKFLARLRALPYSINATSGKKSCMTKPDCSDKKDTGPIPPGIYNIQAADISQPGKVGAIGRLLRSRADWGSFRVRITYAGNAPEGLHDRSGFYLHGGMTPGSAGCIDAGGGL